MPARSTATNGHGPPAIFDARQVAAEAEAEYPAFPFVGMDGVAYELPHPLLLTAGQQQHVIEAQAANNEAGVEVAMWALLEKVAPDAVAAMGDMPAVVVAKLMDAWEQQAMAGEEEGAEGKGPGPRSQPNRAARRSKQTSPSKASTSGRSGSTRSPRVPAL
jgi:hypothetical protein